MPSSTSATHPVPLYVTGHGKKQLSCDRRHRPGPGSSFWLFHVPHDDVIALLPVLATAPAAKDWIEEPANGGEGQLEETGQIMEDQILFWNQVALETNRIDHTVGMASEREAGLTRS